MSAYLPCMEIEDSSCLDEDEVVTKYFYPGYTNLETVAFISDVHNWKSAFLPSKGLEKEILNEAIRVLLLLKIYRRYC